MGQIQPQTRRNFGLTGNLAIGLRSLGIPPQFQSLVIKAVTTGTVPKGTGASSGPPGTSPIVAQVTHAAEGAFASGLDTALSLAGAILLCAAVVAARTTRPRHRADANDRIRPVPAAS